MSNGFEDRVKRLFGSSLFESVPKSSFPSSSWSVADGEVERQEWNRERGLDHEREEDPCSSAFYDKGGCLFKNKKSKRDKQREFEGDLDDDDDDEVEDDDEERARGGDEDEEREIRSSVGLDPTLDNEDEEDEYDKAALCQENVSERIYMSDVLDHGPYMNYHAVVPDFIDEDETGYFPRDLRADHFAASVRLKDDKRTENITKPILKRKDTQTDEKPKKRVRFNSEYNDSEEPQDFFPVPQSMETVGVPDYLKNPSKYTRYTFDSSEAGDGETTNKREFEDFCNLVKKSEPEPEPEPEPDVLPKSVTFTPRKKSSDVAPVNDSPINRKEDVNVLGIAWESDECEMDEDDSKALLVDVNMIARRGRRYRSKLATDGDVI